MDRGKVSNLRGKTLDEISVDDIPVFEDEQIEESVAMHQLEGDNHSDEEGKQSHHDPPVLENTSSDNNSDDEMGIQGSQDQLVLENTSSGKRFFRKQKKKVPWTAEEKKTIFKHFQKNIKQGKNPGRDACRSAVEKFPCLARRTPDNVKDYVRNQIVRLAKGI
ncbi:uncharacterized protein [Apostichopus japonicus]